MEPPPQRALDEILALQLIVAWAGEGKSSPRRLGWWQTDLVSEDGGGDFLARLLPRTHAWASLEAVREAARRADAEARQRLSDPDGVRTLYWLGCELNELVEERLAAHKRSLVSPREALPLPFPLGDDFSEEQLQRALGAGHAEYEALAHGRKLRVTSPAPEVWVRELASALVPFGETYPLPFCQLDG